jgi:hypothetical protein
LTIRKRALLVEPEVEVDPQDDEEFRRLVLTKVEAVVLCLLMVAPAFVRIWNYEEKIWRIGLDVVDVEADPLPTRSPLLCSLLHRIHPEMNAIGSEDRLGGDALALWKMSLVACLAILTRRLMRPDLEHCQWACLATCSVQHMEAVWSDFHS